MQQTKIWCVAPEKPSTKRILAKELKVPEVVAQILVNRGIVAVSEAEQFLFPKLTDLADPFLLPDMQVGAERVVQAIKAGERILVYGDYDVDGVTSTSLLLLGLRNVGANVDYYIPARMSEGYGVNEEAIRKAYAEGVSLIITVDCGITSTYEALVAKELGVDLVITDHHEVQGTLPEAIAVIDPKREDNSYPTPYLAGVGVAFKLLQAVYSYIYKHKDYSRLAVEYLDIVALGTVADIVPLQQENRVMVKYGLEIMNKGNRTGLRALQEVAGLMGKELTSTHLAFAFAPRINAIGRLGDARMGVALLLCQDHGQALEIAATLDAENRHRQEVEGAILEEAVKQVEQLDLDANKVLVLAAENWHPGVIGIVASRIVERYYRPTIMIGVADGIGKASCRSIPGFDIFAALTELSSFLVKFGGHPQAAGLTIEEQKIVDFRAAINSYAEQLVTEELLQPKLKVDVLANVSELNMNLLDQLAKLAPFGFKNPEPVIVSRAITVQDWRCVGEQGNHLKLVISRDKFKINGIAFQQGHWGEQLDTGKTMDVAFALERNHFNGRTSLQVQVKQLKYADQPDNPFTLAEAADQSSFVDSLFAEAEATLEDDYYRNYGELDQFHTKLVGVTYEQRQDIIKYLQEGTQVELVREPANVYDPNAIKVQLIAGAQIGYLNRKLAKHLAPVMDQGQKYEALITAVTGGGDRSYGVNIDIFKAATQSEAEQAQELASMRANLAVLREEELRSHIKDALIGQYSYHQKQEQAITILLEGHSALAIFGTGRGKSAVFQTVAAYKALRQSLVTVIAYPLRALVNDQYQAMQRKLSPLGLRVKKGNGSLTDVEKAKLFADLATGEIDILLTTPEFVNYHIERLNPILDRLGLFVVDESHHVGLSQRGGYKHIDRTLALLGNPLTLAVTATANEQVTAAIMRALNINTLIVDPHVRSNLSLVDQRNVRDKTNYVRKLVKQGGKTIIYVNSRQQAIELAGYLRETVPELKDKIVFYNAGLSNEQRVTVEKLFRTSNLQVVVATSAFGEGIDIPDVENVVLYHLNFNQTEFNQQSGRAGRDGRQAKIHLLFGTKDVAINQLILEGTNPSREVLGKLYVLLKQMLAKDNPITASNSQLAELLEQQGLKEVRDTTVSVGISILAELGLVERELQGRNRALTLLPAPEQKLSLESSLRYVEGLQEKAEFQTFQQQVLAQSAEELLQMINKPIYPQEIGGNQNGL